MTIVLDLQPDIERGLMSQARLRGVSLEDYVQEIVAREAHLPEQVFEPPRPTQAANLVELFEPIRGLLTDEEIDRLFNRNRSMSRPIDLP